jgi:photosystem II stability/assembly factor-like uncharacterized protein
MLCRLFFKGRMPAEKNPRAKPANPVPVKAGITNAPGISYSVKNDAQPKKTLPGFSGPRRAQTRPKENSLQEKKMNCRFPAFTILAWIIFSAAAINAAPAAPPASEKEASLAAALASGLPFRNIGPALSSGRISDVVMHPRERATWYVAAGSGGVWKTEDAGSTWSPIFDHENSYSIGCLAVDPRDPAIVWVGTGENISGRHVGFGDGVYKSLDDGKTWKNMGLKTSEHIGRILIDPRDGRVVYVAAEGPLWAPGGERGIFKSVDGGRSWQPSLQVSKDTGACDIVMEPGNPDILYAAAYQRRRSVAAFMAGGPEGGIYKSEDGGRDFFHRVPL